MMYRIYRLLYSVTPFDSLEAYKGRNRVPPRKLLAFIALDTAFTLAAGIAIGAWLF